MHRSPVQALSILLLGVALLSACQTEGQPSGVTTAPLSLTPTNTPSGGISSAPETSGSTGTEPERNRPGVLFRDDFDAPLVDTRKWKVYEKSGVVRQKDGWLEVSSISGGNDFPFVLLNGNHVPETGSWYFETRAQWFNLRPESSPTSLNLDVLPPTGPEDAGFVAPTIQIRPSWFKPTITFRTGSQDVEKQREDTSGAAFTVRVECDEKNRYRVMTNDELLFEATSSRRPKTFWVGNYPNSPQPGASWAHWRVDYVEFGIQKNSSATTSQEVETAESEAKSDSP